MLGQTKRNEDILVETWWYPCRRVAKLGSVGNRSAKLALERNGEAEQSSVSRQFAREGFGCFSGMLPKVAQQALNKTRTHAQALFSIQVKRPRRLADGFKV